MPDMPIVLKRATKDRWVQLDPILMEGEPGFERDTGKFKIGNGTLHWTELPYFSAGWEVAMRRHYNSEKPHPVYDDGPSFVLLYENAKV